MARTPNLLLRDLHQALGPRYAACPKPRDGDPERTPPTLTIMCRHVYGTFGYWMLWRNVMDLHQRYTMYLRQTAGEVRCCGEGNNAVRLWAVPGQGELHRRVARASRVRITSDVTVILTVPLLKHIELQKAFIFQISPALLRLTAHDFSAAQEGHRLSCSWARNYSSEYYGARSLTFDLRPLRTSCERRSNLAQS